MANIFAPELVYEREIAALRRLIDALNLQRKDWYELAHSNWVKNYLAAGYDRAKVERFFPLPAPPPALALDPAAPVFPDYAGIVESKIPVMGALLIPEPPKTEPEPGTIYFGLPIVWDGPEAYHAAGSAGPVGRRVQRNGRAFELRQLGQRGSIVYLLYWQIIE